MLAPPALLQSTPKEDAAVWQRDLAAFDAELTRRRAVFAAKHLSIECREDVKQILSALADLDQFMRSHWADPYAHGYGGTPSEQAFLTAFRPRATEVDADNRRILKTLLDRWGWFDRAAWGDQADRNAWLLVQHADDDLPFQKRVLAMLEPLLKVCGTNQSNYAYLFDRVAVNDHRLQRYGTQGYCTGPGTWKPRPIEDVEHVDERRESVGLGPLADYIATFKGLCHEDETERALKALPLPPQAP